jgi:DUF971 family protein
MYPVQIKSHTPQEILIAWEQDQTFILSYLDLRFGCQCASCIDEHTGKRTLLKSSLDPALKVTQVKPVGRYAVQIDFSDGHATGIYHFDRLYDLCQKQGYALKENA